MTEANPPIRPLLCVEITPRFEGDRERLQQALNDLVREISSARVSTDLGGRTMIDGLSELHLSLVCDRLARQVEIEVGRTRVVYVETIRKPAAAEGKYIRQTGGCGQYGHVQVRLAPNEPGKGFEFENACVGGSVPEEYIKPIEMGINEAMECGVVAGYPMVDIKASLYDGSYHEVDSIEMAFKIAASMAFKEAAHKASPVLLEPVMSVEVVVPEEYMGTIIGDLNSRRGRIEGIEHRAGSQVIKSTVPLAEMLGYEGYIQSITRERVTLSMRFLRYDETIAGDGADEAGVTANLPWKPKGRSGAASATPDATSMQRDGGSAG